MLQRILFCFVALTVMAGASVSAWAEERFALVVGNGKYQTIAALPNPTRDAEAIGNMLKSAGFDVTSALDLDQTSMRRSVREFADKVAGKGKDTVALVYFAGHGLQIDGQNYLLPVDANIKSQADVSLEAVRLSDVMNLLNTIPSKTRIVILDACRNNPFEAIENKIGRGLAVVNAPAGTLVAYSTSPGAVAEDGTTSNSPFTGAFVQAAKQPGADIGVVLQNVRNAVHTETNGRQTPWEVTALTDAFQFFPGKPDAETGDENGGELPPLRLTAEDWRKDLKARTPDEAYEIVVRGDNVILYQIFVELFPNSELGRRIRGIMERRIEMFAWFDAVTINSAEAFAAFLKRFPESDLLSTAKRMKQQAEERANLIAFSSGALNVGSNLLEPVVREVRVPVIKEVIKEVPVVKIKEVIKEVPVVKIKEVVRIKEVPVVRIKEVVKIKKVRVPVVKTKTIIKRVRVRTGCKCSGRRTRREPRIRIQPQFSIGIGIGGGQRGHSFN